MHKDILQAIKVHQGEVLPIGTPCAHPSDPMTYELMYDGDVAVLSYNGTIKRFPACEIFDVNKVRRTAVEIHVESVFENSKFN